MLFHSFANQDERRKFGGSAFIEFQYCTYKSTTKLKKIVNKHEYWTDSSLYVHVDDIERFHSDYGDIFYGGTYHDLQSGEVDIYGINYYTPAQLKDIILKVEEKKPLDYETILEWLRNGERFNGFYILGI